MRFLALMVFLTSIPLTPACAQDQRPNLIEIALRYEHAQDAVMTAGAGPSQADALISFYADNFVYYHPAVGAKVAGLKAVRQGVDAHLGELASARIEVKGVMVSGNIVSLSLEEQFKQADGQEIIRPRVTVLTFAGSKIVQRIDV